MTTPTPTARAAGRVHEVQAGLAGEIGLAAATAGDERLLAQRCAERLGALFGAERVGILAGAAGEPPRTIGRHGPEPAGRPAPAPCALGDRALADGSVAWSADDDPADDDATTAAMRAAGRRGAMVAAIPDPHGSRGWVHVVTDRPGAWGPSDLRVLEHAVAVLGAGLARIDLERRLHDAVHHAREVAARVHRLGPLAEELATCRRDEEVFAATTRAVPALLLAERGGVALIAGDELVIHEPLDEGALETTVVATVPMARSVLRLLTDGLHDELDERHGGEEHPEVAAMRAGGFRSWRITPIRHGDRLLGTINVAARRPGAFDDDDAELLRSLARLLGATLQRLEDERHAEEEIRRREERLRELAERLAEQAVRDPLTDLHNRRGFEQAVAEALREDGEGGVLAFCDLDHFKLVNDAEGYPAGDRLLRQVARVLVRTLPGDAVVGRLGGDEFGVLMPRSDSATAVAAIEATRAAVRDAFAPGSSHDALGLSAGVVALEPSLSVPDAIAAADIACHQAKESGRDRVRVFRGSDEDVQRRRSEVAWTTRIRDALREGRFVVHGQPILHLGDTPEEDVVHRWELLLRMLDEDGAIVPPAEFLPAAERFDLTPRLDRWVLEQGIALLEARPGLRVSTNLSPRSIADPEFGAWLVSAVRAAAPEPRALAFEVTETAVVRDLDVAGELLGELRDLGCRSALDDFGSGVASLGYLRRLPVDTVKLDGTLVREVDRDPAAHAVLSAITELARALGLRSIAEHISRPSLLETVRALGIGGAQGFAIGRPQPMDEVVGGLAPGRGPEAGPGSPGR